MTAVSVLNGATPTVIFTPSATRGFRFIHIYNNGNATVFIKFDDGTDALTVNNGFPIPAGETYVLENSYADPKYVSVISAIHSSGSAQEVRIQST